MKVYKARFVSAIICAMLAAFIVPALALEGDRETGKVECSVDLGYLQIGVDPPALYYGVLKFGVTEESVVVTLTNTGTENGWFLLSGTDATVAGDPGAWLLSPAVGTDAFVLRAHNGEVSMNSMILSSTLAQVIKFGTTENLYVPTTGSQEMSIELGMPTDSDKLLGEAATFDINVGIMAPT